MEREFLSILLWLQIHVFLFKLTLNKSERDMNEVSQNE